MASDLGCEGDWQVKATWLIRKNVPEERVQELSAAKRLSHWDTVCLSWAGDTLESICHIFSGVFIRFCLLDIQTHPLRSLHRCAHAQTRQQQQHMRCCGWKGCLWAPSTAWPPSINKQGTRLTWLWKYNRRNFKYQTWLIWLQCYRYLSSTKI